MKFLTAISWVIGISIPVGACAQAPIISSFGQNGELVCTNLLPGSTAIVEWAPSITGPWTNTWSGLTAVAVDANGTMRASVPMFYRVRGLPPDTNLAWIPPGTFTMGSPTNELGHDNPEGPSVEGPQTVVTLSRGFWMGRREVTQGEYLSVMGNNPSGCNGYSYYYQTNFGTDLSRPVENVTWSNAFDYCASLTVRERFLGRLPADYAYRLPTEAEWEYACRAGTTTPFHFGNELHSGMENFDGRHEYPPCGINCSNPSGIFLNRTVPVGSYAPNPWGLYDMHGNVSEWCQGWAGAYPGGAVIDPQPPSSGSWRIARGGGFYFWGESCRSAMRVFAEPSYYNVIGFRVVLARVRP